jgi:HK97 family phage major capsid protein
VWVVQARDDFMSTYDEILARSGLVTAGMINPKYVPGVIQETITQSAVMSLMRKEPNMSTKIESRSVMSLFPEAYWVETEAGDGGGVEPLEGLIETSKQGWTNSTITAAKMGVVIPIPKDTIADLADGYDLWAEIKPRIAESIARKFDQAVLWDDTNAPAAFPDSIYAGCVSNSMTIDKSATVGSALTFKDMYDAVLGEAGLFSLIEGKRYNVDGIIADLGQKAVLRGLRSADGVPLWATDNGKGTPSYSLGGVEVKFPENDSLSPSTALMIAGNWKKAFYAWRQDIQLSMTDTGMITDATGLVRLNAFQQDVVLLKATCRIGWCCPIPVDIASTASRYPFAALIP